MVKFKGVHTYSRKLDYFIIIYFGGGECDIFN